MPDIIILGAGGQAKVLADIASKMGYSILGFLDDDPNIQTVMGYPVLGVIDQCEQFGEEVFFAIGIGNAIIRQKIYREHPSLKYATLIHPSSQIAMQAKIGEGTVVMAGTVIGPAVKIGRFCIVNSCAVVDHDSCMDDFSHAAPRSTVCGMVKIGKRVWLGAGSTISNNITICDDVLIGAGAVVVRDICELGTYVGVPAHCL